MLDSFIALLLLAIGFVLGRASREPEVFKESIKQDIKNVTKGFKKKEPTTISSPSQKVQANKAFEQDFEIEEV